MAAAFEAFFAAVRPGPLGQRLCIWHAPPEGKAPHSLIVFIHAFAEEMNKSRRMAALQSRAFAAAGHAVLQMDLLGCGDSAGDFGDASWQAWVDDVVDAVGLAFERHSQAWPGAPRPELWLWGHRMGCLLACAAAPRLDTACSLLFWQPTLNGKTVLQQFLRLEVAGALMGKTSAPKGRSARARLDAGESVEIAGYRIHPALASGLDSARLEPSTRAPRLEWLDLGTDLPPGASPAAKQALCHWLSAGATPRHHAVQGPSFWQTTEIEDAPALVDATLAALQPPTAAATARGAGAGSLVEMAT